MLNVPLNKVEVISGTVFTVIFWLLLAVFRPYQMHEMLTILTDVHAVCLSVSQSVT